MKSDSKFVDGVTVEVRNGAELLWTGTFMWIDRNRGAFRVIATQSNVSYVAVGQETMPAHHLRIVLV